MKREEYVVKIVFYFIFTLNVEFDSIRDLLKDRQNLGHAAGHIRTKENSRLHYSKDESVGSIKNIRYTADTRNRVVSFNFWQIEEVHRQSYMRLVDIPTMTKGHSPWSDVNKVVVTTLRALYRIPLKDVKSMLVKGASHSVRRDSLCTCLHSRVFLLTRYAAVGASYTS